MSYPSAASSTVCAAVPGDTAEGWDPSPPDPPVWTSESRAVIMMLCMPPRPGLGAAVTPLAHVLTATRKHGDAHN